MTEEIKAIKTLPESFRWRSIIGKNGSFEPFLFGNLFSIIILYINSGLIMLIFR